MAAAGAAEDNAHPSTTATTAADGHLLCPLTLDVDPRPWHASRTFARDVRTSPVKRTSDVGVDDGFGISVWIVAAI
jgi:hypothetical protein